MRSVVLANDQMLCLNKNRSLCLKDVLYWMEVFLKPLFGSE